MPSLLLRGSDLFDYGLELGRYLGSHFFCQEPALQNLVLPVEVFRLLQKLQIAVARKHSFEVRNHNAESEPRSDLAQLTICLRGVDLDFLPSRVLDFQSSVLPLDELGSVPISDQSGHVSRSKE